MRSPDLLKVQNLVGYKLLLPGTGPRLQFCRNVSSIAASLGLGRCYIRNYLRITLFLLGCKNILYIDEKYKSQNHVSVFLAV